MRQPNSSTGPPVADFLHTASAYKVTTPLLGLTAVAAGSGRVMALTGESCLVFCHSTSCVVSQCAGGLSPLRPLCRLVKKRVVRSVVVPVAIPLAKKL
jgi:hypothetical protein